MQLFFIILLPINIAFRWTSIVLGQQRSGATGSHPPRDLCRPVPYTSGSPVRGTPSPGHRWGSPHSGLVCLWNRIRLGAE